MPAELRFDGAGTDRLPETGDLMADGAVTWARAVKDTTATRRADERPASLPAAGRNQATRLLPPSRVPPSRVPAHGTAVTAAGSASWQGGVVRQQQGLRPSAATFPESTWIGRLFRQRFPRLFRNRPPAAVTAAPTAPAAPSVLIATETQVPAPDGTPNDRTTVGLGEQVMMTPSVASQWEVDDGTISPDLTGNTEAVIWTAPSYPGTFGVKAVPESPADADPGEVTMNVIYPKSVSLASHSDSIYPAHNAGSGFIAAVTVQPTSVSFAGTEIRESSAPAVADGFYYAQNGAEHPAGAWFVVDNSNNGISDTVGVRYPGYPPPFSEGRFRWTIPQYFRGPGSTSSTGAPFDSSAHLQVMAADGTETTSKQGATRTRRPDPAPLVPQAQGVDDTPTLVTSRRQSSSSSGLGGSGSRAGT